MKPYVLVVEDEAPIQELLAYNLEQNGFEVAQAYDGEDALLAIAERLPDLVILDWMLPHLSGIEVCRRLRRKPATQRLPVIILTARAEEPDRLRGLDTGADDFIVKPFSVAEVIARTRAVLRRARPALDEPELRVGALRLDLVGHRVFRGERELHLSPTEFRLLRHLMEHPGRVFGRATLLDAVWGINQEVELRTVDATVRRLRKALNGPGEPDLLRTVRAEGYALKEPAMAEAQPADTPA